jgi:Ca2+-binding RTX toxin-like protein
MTGGGGNDTFEFNNPLDGGGQGSAATITTANTDQITDFSTANDAIAVSAAGFDGGLTVGEVFDSTQVQNASNNIFTNSAERFLFDTSNHTLYYSPDGTTANEHAVAILNLVAAINPANIHVVH